MLAGLLCASGSPFVVTASQAVHKSSLHDREVASMPLHSHAVLCKVWSAHGAAEALGTLPLHSPNILWALLRSPEAK